MSDQYRYIDPESIYFNPETGVLRNLQNITNAEVLLFVESSSVTKRLQELYENPISIRGIDSLFQIHKYLFQDIYHWAGRKTHLSKIIFSHYLVYRPAFGLKNHSKTVATLQRINITPC